MGLEPIRPYGKGILSRLRRFHNERSGNGLRIRTRAGCTRFGEFAADKVSEMNHLTCRVPSTVFLLRERPLSLGIGQ